MWIGMYGSGKEIGIWRGVCAAYRLPLPMGEVPPKGAERALSVMANAVPAPPKGEPRALHASPPNSNLQHERTGA